MCSFGRKQIMAESYNVRGRNFRTSTDYKLALKDKETIDKLNNEIKDFDKVKLQLFLKNLQGGRYRFYTILGDDYIEEITEKIDKFNMQQGNKQEKRKSHSYKDNSGTELKVDDDRIEVLAMERIVKAAKKRKVLTLACWIVAFLSFGSFMMYEYFNYRTGKSYEELSALKDKPVINNDDSQVVIHYVDEEPVEREVLEEYKNLLNKNKKLIGWLKIDDTNIDYPVMQTSDNEYYLDHNINQEYDKNGSIFMDKDCDVIKGSTNYILYGHHMKNGQMFGKLGEYEDEEYFKEHRYIQFDTIYEKGTYEVMYVFRSKVYSEEEITFKYYQFIDANSEQEFDSYMNDMAAMSYYDTGVTAKYGDKLLTLSTCDYQETNGRFVVVAKKVTSKE